ncbi:MAC/perforin domain-containing protein [Pedobacter sp. Hv1]|uniref:MAC/perforin domain-containing protein n=1 Tax=Pedobacter sp. Hv1 TaxID=1740090 RepID=UPI0006D898C5|nr:MAC/perforin domain-containing protein [Pedobacter sp. Hv1]KQB99086.1 hypothetical protein AQF98_19230 [Pedobacter sp. Hv1]
MKKTILALAMLSAALGACKKNNENIPKKETVLPKDIGIAVSWALPAPTTSEGNVTYNFLGYGYDVTDKYADAAAVRASVINIPLLAIDHLSRINVSTGTSYYWSNWSGENATDLSSKLSNSLDETKGLKMFGKTISKAFPNFNVFDSKYFYGYYSNISVQKRLRMTGDVEMLKYLTSSFVQDVNVLSAEDLVKKYGTHILKDIELGARLNVVYQAETANNDRKKISTTGLRYAMQKVFGLPTGELGPIDLAALNANAGAKLHYEATGGDVRELKSLSPLPVNITNWYKSITLETAKFIGVTEKGLVPLYDLITDNQKKMQVKEYIVKYLEEQEVKLKN